MKTSLKDVSYIYIYILTVTILTSLSFVSFLFLASSSIFASDHVSNVSVTVPVSCNISSTLDAAHTATINPGQVKADIGTTTFKVFCNDNTGYAIYAIGYSNDEYGNTNMLPASSSSTNPGSSTNPSIVTGTATSGDTSNWAMKITPVDGTYKPTIESDTNGSFTNYHIVPDTYTKVATLTTNTDFTIGSSFQSTYRVFVSQTQPADTYTGKVKYTLVHPNDTKPPEDPRFIANLDTGQTVNRKLKRLAGNSSATYDTQDNGITALVRSDTLPSDFTPTTANTISTTSSGKPIYAWYDSTNKTIYYYSEATTIKMNQNSSYFFSRMMALSDLSTISSWNTSSVTYMSDMFRDAGYNATTFTLDLSSWNTSSVTDMSNMFYYAGYNATTFTLDLSSWDTSSVTRMTQMFSLAGYSATTFTLDLSSWNTSSVTTMYCMFCYAGYNATTFALDLSSWDTSKVTEMTCMFEDAGYSATTWSIGDLSSWNTSSVTNMSNMFNSAGYSATTFTLDLSSWDTSSVTRMTNMFFNAGYKATTFTLDLSSWDTSSVTDMSYMFYSAGYRATTWSVTIPKTNKGSTPITNTTTRLYGNTASVYATPRSGKSFTLAN